MKIKLTRKKRIFYIVLTIVLELILAVLVIYGIRSSALMTSSAVGGAVLLLMLLIPVLLVALLLAVIAGKKKGTEKTRAAAAPATSTTPKSPAPATEGTRFSTLSEIDRESHSYSHRTYDRGVTLDRFCEDFRNFAAYKMSLYYEIDDIRRFIAGMAVSKILILQGMSGTGKTSLANAFGEFVENGSTVIPVQPMWKERTDLIGYYNEFTKHFNETTLLKVMYKANYSQDMFVTVLDEMNIARVEYYFAEFLSLLELPNPEKRQLVVVSDTWESDPKLLKKGCIKLPENMWFIGTANNDDSTFAISDKVYDRAMILDLDKKSEPFTAPATRCTHLSAGDFFRLTEAATKEFSVSSRNRKRLQQLDQYLIDHFHITFGNRIMKQINQYIPVYIACGGDELVALDDILAKKIIRKLETQNPIYLRKAADDLLKYLEDLFGPEHMTACKDAIKRLQRNA